MATNEFVTTPVTSYLWAGNPPARKHHAMPECSNYRSSGLGLKPRQWRASVRVLNPAKAEEQYIYEQGHAKKDLMAFLVNFQFLDFLVAHNLKITPLKTVLKSIASSLR